MSLDDETTRVARLVETSLGVGVKEVAAVAAGIGARRFYRVATEGVPATLIARVETPEIPGRRPPGHSPEPALEPIRAFLAAQGLPVPGRLGADADAGIELLEDLGSLTLGAAVANADAATRRGLYAEAVALVPRFQACRDPGDLAAFRRRLDPALIAFKGSLFAEHSLAQALGRAPTPAERGAVGAAFACIAEALETAPRRLAHRDFQSQNLLVQPDAPAGARLRPIDLQGAFLAPPEYDLVCLLRDSYVELPEHEVTQHLEAVREALPDAPEAEEFARRFDLLTLARKGKDHARFLQAAAAGDPRWLPYLPATARALGRAAVRSAGLDSRLQRLAELVAALPGARAAEGGAPCVE